MSGPIIQYWHSDEVPTEVDGLIASFRECNPDMEHLLFDEPRAERFIARHVGPRELAAFRACAVPAMQADYFRYCAVLTLGGIYCDADFECRGPLGPLLEEIDTGQLLGLPRLPPAWSEQTIFGAAGPVGRHRILNNSFFAFNGPGHPFLRLSLDIATANIERRVVEDVSLTTGPGVFTSLYLIRQLMSLDAFREYASHGVLGPLAPLTCEVVGEIERVERAFDGVRIMTGEEYRRWFVNLGRNLSYKESEVHWPRWAVSIFR